MEVKTTICNITHDDLVNLFSCALYGSTWLGASYDHYTYDSLPTKKEGDSLEDKLAMLLLAGHTITLMDFLSEGDYEYYGHHVHSYSEEGCMNYTICLQDVKEGIEKALNDKDKFTRHCAFDLVYDEGCDLDLCEADVIVQLILFGEQIYG